MNVKILAKIVLISGGIIVGNIGSGFAWKCSAGHKHQENIMCMETGERPCGECEMGFHRDYEVCPNTVFRVSADGIKYVILPLNVPDKEIITLQVKYQYAKSGKEKNDIRCSPLKSNKYEINRLKGCVEALAKKYPLDKAKDKKESDGEWESDGEDVWNSSDASYEVEKLLKPKKKSGAFLKKKRLYTQEKSFVKGTEQQRKNLENRKLKERIILDESEEEIEQERGEKKMGKSLSNKKLCRRSKVLVKKYPLCKIKDKKESDEEWEPDGEDVWNSSDVLCDVKKPMNRKKESGKVSQKKRLRTQAGVLAESAEKKRLQVEDNKMIKKLMFGESEEESSGELAKK